MSEAAKTSGTDGTAKLTLSIEVASFVLLVLYVAVTALQQSDVELILPTSKFDVGGLLERFKDGVPGGAFLAPILKVEVPLSLFYTAGPMVLLMLHALVILRPGLLAQAPPPLRFLAIWLPPAAMALIRWRFVPFVSARPEPPLSGQVLEALQSVALLVDTWLVACALMPLTVFAGPGQRARVLALRLRALRHAAIVLAIAVLGSEALRVTVAAGDEAAPISESGLGPAAPAVAAGILLVWLFGGRWRASEARTFPQGSSTGLSLQTEDLHMAHRLGLAIVFGVFLALPALAHGPDFSDESLVARAPSETILAAYVTAAGSRLALDAEWDNRRRMLVDARNLAWDAFGRGLALEGWRFPRASFKGAAMAKIKLNGAKLASASFDYAELYAAEFDRVTARGASFRYANAPFIHLTAANLSGADFTGADLSNIIRVDDPVLVAGPASTAAGPAISNIPCDAKHPPHRLHQRQSERSASEGRGPILRDLPRRPHGQGHRAGRREFAASGFLRCTSEGCGLP